LPFLSCPAIEPLLLEINPGTLGDLESPGETARMGGRMRNHLKQEDYLKLQIRVV
jgi:hypothetical protein